MKNNTSPCTVTITTLVSSETTVNLETANLSSCFHDPAFLSWDLFSFFSFFFYSCLHFEYLVLKLSKSNKIKLHYFVIVIVGLGCRVHFCA